MKYVALIRGISPMNAPSAKLRSLFEDMGFSGVQTVISSGNVIFESAEKSSDKLEAVIEKTLREELGISSDTIVQSSEQISQLVAKQPFGKLQHSPSTYLTVTFLKQAASDTTIEGRDFEIIGSDRASKTVFAVNDTTKQKTPDLMIKLEKKFGKAITTRTWNTVLKIHQKMK